LLEGAILENGKPGTFMGTGISPRGRLPRRLGDITPARCTAHFGQGTIGIGSFPPPGGALGWKGSSRKLEREEGLGKRDLGGVYLRPSAIPCTCRAPEHIFLCPGKLAPVSWGDGHRRWGRNSGLLAHFEGGDAGVREGPTPRSARSFAFWRIVADAGPGAGSSFKGLLPIGDAGRLTSAGRDGPSRPSGTRDAEKGGGHPKPLAGRPGRHLPLQRTGPGEGPTRTNRRALGRRPRKGDPPI